MGVMRFAGLPDAQIPIQLDPKSLLDESLALQCERVGADANVAEESAMNEAAGAVATLAGSAPAARRKGPLVWLDMDQQELDAAYDQIKYAPNRDQVHTRNAANSDAARARIGAPRRLAYGTTPIEGLELYATPKPNAPINVFIHGGAWRQRPIKDYALPAEMLVKAGAHYIVVDFIGVDEADGNLLPMAEQVRRAVAWVHRNAKSFGGDPNRLYVSGHSSGAHLAGVVLTTDWQKDFGLPADLVKGGVCCSGMYDLTPVSLSARSTYVKFTGEMIEALSSQRHLDRLNCPIVVAHGSEETPEFQRQARDFAAAVRAAGKPVQLLTGAGYNHFEMYETFGNPYGLVGRALMEQMGL
jgi:arylformamidase